MTWPAKILARVEGHALVQVPGGILSVIDLDQLLQVGEATTVVVTASEMPIPDGLFVGAFRVARHGPWALLQCTDAAFGAPRPLVVPLLLRPDETLPTGIQLVVRTLPVEVDEGVSPSSLLPCCPPCDPIDCWALLLTECLCPPE